MRLNFDDRNRTLKGFLHSNAGSIIDKEKVVIRPLRNERIMSEKQIRS